LVAGAVTAARAQTNYIIDQFDTDTTGSYGYQGWGDSVPVITWDDTKNATTTMGPNNPGSGSSEWSITWVTENDQFLVVYNLPANNIDLVDNYTNLSFDIMFDPSSATDGNGSYGGIEFGVIPTHDGWADDGIGVYTSAVTNGNGWIHVSLPLNISDSKLALVEGLYFKMQQARTGFNLAEGGTTLFWLDNIIFGAKSANVPAPTVTIKRFTTPQGLYILSGETGGTYTRSLLGAEDVVNGTRNHSWIGQGSTPVTYSTTITSYPDTNHTAYQSVIFLVQNANMGDAGIDYDGANVAELVVMNNANGTATGSFQFKTNDAYANDGFQSYGNVGSVTAAGPLGTWGLTFLNDTNVTLWGPGVSTNLHLPDETSAQMFANPLTVFFGSQQNGDWNNGQGATYSEFKISGTQSTNIDDKFPQDASLDTTNTWYVTATAPQNIFLTHSTDQAWVYWTLPDTGWTLQANNNIANAAGWASAGVASPASISALGTAPAYKVALMPEMSTNYPVGQNVFFRMAK
jgi:hypothetical protein